MHNWQIYKHTQCWPWQLCLAYTTQKIINPRSARTHMFLVKVILLVLSCEMVFLLKTEQLLLAQQASLVTYNPFYGRTSKTLYMLLLSNTFSLYVCRKLPIFCPGPWKGLCPEAIKSDKNRVMFVFMNQIITLDLLSTLMGMAYLQPRKPVQ